MSHTSGLWVVLVTPVIHYTLGGLEINEQAEVLWTPPSKCTSGSDTEIISKKPLLGSYSAGESSGGVHGHDRLAGNSLLECIVFGRTAGKQAGEYAKQVSSIET